MNSASRRRREEAPSTLELIRNSPVKRIERAQMKREIAYRLLEEADADEQAARDQQRADEELRSDMRQVRRLGRLYGGGELGAFVERRKR